MNPTLVRVARLKHDLAMRALQRALEAKRQAMAAWEEAQEQLRYGQTQIRRTQTCRLREGKAGEYGHAWRWASQLQKRLTEGEAGQQQLSQELDRLRQEWRQACFALGRAQVLAGLTQK